ncbi:hypothetical protein GGR58DRAFT_34444 [Xylaria digitata]|nr:hypothetical protein GGR58DRAFT_34444 [Xylaria digitata]
MTSAVEIMLCVCSSSFPCSYVEDPDMIPKPPYLPSHHPPRSGSESPTKRAKTGLNSRESLPRLEKPVLLTKLEGNVAHIPQDIKALYKNIRAVAQDKQRIVPHEVRSQIEAADDDDIPDSTFRDLGQKQANALATHSTICSIVRVAGVSENYKRLEAGWNHHVHTPL